MLEHLHENVFLIFYSQLLLFFFNPAGKTITPHINSNTDCLFIKW